jgi:L-aspartate oxidase
MKMPTLEPHVVRAERWLWSMPPVPAQEHSVPLLIVGSGAAGLMAALEAAQHTTVIILTRGPLLQSNSAWAQGGIAAALAPDDAPASQVDDTLIAGAGLSDRAAVEALAAEAPDLMHDLLAAGVPFEHTPDGFALGLEGGHSHRRIVHASDATGWAVTSTLAELVRACPSISVFEGYQVVDLLGDNGACTGVRARDGSGGWHDFHARATILATGGAGALYGLTSNQPAALGEGIALAYRAGAEVADMEFVQFHPTVFRTGTGKGFLISEAVRGEGGHLRTIGGHRFMPDYDSRAELAPRDIVSRSIFEVMRRESVDHVLLDMRHLSKHTLLHHFPTIVARCRAEGIDPATTPIPVAPAAHYLMGGVRTDLDGMTSLAGLYAAGECACTGVHGANRLASNSLLECLVFGRRAAHAALEHGAASGNTHNLTRSHAHPADLGAAWPEDAATLMRTCAGLLRTAEDLRHADDVLGRMDKNRVDDVSSAISRRNATLTARLIICGALLREESRGAHQRSDFPHTEERWRAHIVQVRDTVPVLVDTVATAESCFGTT